MGDERHPPNLLTGKYDPGRGPVIYADLLIVPFGDNRVFAYRLK